MRVSFGLAAVLGVLGLAVGAAAAQTVGAPDPRLGKLIEAARQEGGIDFAGPASLTPKGAQALIAGLNKRYNVNLRLNYVPNANYPGLAAQVITEGQAGQPPTYDAIYLTEINLAKIHGRGFLETFDWTGTFGHITKDGVHFDGGAVLVATIFGLPAYNRNVVKSEDVPRQWEDLLAPRWRGKIVVPRDAQVWVSLSSVWGEEKTLEFLKQLKAQELLFGLYPEIPTRVASGEYPVAATLVSPLVELAKQRGMPIEYMDQVTPFPVLLDMMAIPKKARHPNAARLLAAFSLTPQGQETWVGFTGRSSLFIPGTPAARFVQGKKLLFRDLKALVERPEHFERLERRFSDVLGIR